MPPRRSARGAAAAAAVASASPAPASAPLDGCVVCLSGSFLNVTQTEAKNKVTSLGARVSSSVTKDTTHLITTENDYLGSTTKVKAAVAKDLPIVGFDWVLECEEQNQKVDLQAFDIPTKANAAQATVNSQQKKAAATAKAGSKRGASAAAASDDEQSDAKPKPKRTRKAANGKASATPAESEDDSKPAPQAKAAKANGKAKVKKAAKDEPEEEEEEDAKPAPKPAAKSKAKGKKAAKDEPEDEEEDTKPAPKPAAKSKAKGKKAVKDEPEEDDEEDAKPAPKAAPKAKATKAKAKDENKDKVEAADGQIAKSSNVHVPIDEACLWSGYAVHIDDSGHIWDASLNQTNAGNNNNKFYRVQVIRNNAGDFKTWTRWGRVGERGQNATLGNGSEADAIKNFEKKFKDKSGLSWEDRLKPAKPGKYTFIERSYNPESEEDEDAEDDAEEAKIGTWVPPESKLKPEVQNLMQLIFNQKFFDAAMTELNYDANKLPLGRLSKQTISRGFQALKDLSAILDDNSIAEDLYPDLSVDGAIEHLSNSYYSVIPHAFGRNRPPVIREESLLKKEIELLESLSDMKDANIIMDKDKKSKGDPVHPLDKMYNGLHMNEMSPLEHSSDEFKLIKDYLNNTRGETHGHSYTVKEIFRIEREGEHQRFDEHPDLGGELQDRRLLWHGSRVTNFGGILSQGLRIAPPEAPVSGYMFGKGIYLADMSSKSANYCCSYISGGEALLLLCEAELGDPMLTLTNADYEAGEKAEKQGMYSTWGQGMVGPKEWKDAGDVNESLKGVKMPDTTNGKPGKTNVSGAYLMYNEYIVYNVAQVRLRYLLRVKM